MLDHYSRYILAWKLRDGMAAKDGSGEFVEYCNRTRHHEIPNSLTPEDVHTGRGQAVSNRGRKIKQKTL